MPEMSLDNVITGIRPGALRIVLYGVDGIGKSTFAAGSPRPIFLCAEDGTSFLPVARFPHPNSWDDVLAAIGVLYKEQHNYKTLVIDTVDWLEDLARKAVCTEHGVSGIEGMGYGKGYIYAAEKMMSLLRGLDALSQRRGMNIIVLGHSQVVTYNDPETEAYDRYAMKLHKGIEPKFREWPDAVLFANYDVTVEKDDQGFNKTRTRGISFGKRVLYTERRAAFDAKNRFPGMPPKLPLTWEAFSTAVAASLNSLMPQPEVQPEPEAKPEPEAPAPAPQSNDPF